MSVSLELDRKQSREADTCWPGREEAQRNVKQSTRMRHEPRSGVTRALREHQIRLFTYCVLRCSTTLDQAPNEPNAKSARRILDVANLGGSRERTNCRGASFCQSNAIGALSGPAEGETQGMRRWGMGEIAGRTVTHLGRWRAECKGIILGGKGSSLDGVQWCREEDWKDMGREVLSRNEEGDEKGVRGR